MIDNGYGWIKLNRKIVDTSFYDNTDAVRLAIHLLLKANYKDTDACTQRGDMLSLSRGQYLGGIKRIMRELKWGKGRARRAFYVLVKASFIKHYYNNRYAITTISNFSKYQFTDSGSKLDTQEKSRGSSNEGSGVQFEGLEGPELQQQGVQDRPHIKNKRKNKEITNIVRVCDFEKIWAMYPTKGKIGKKTAFNKMKLTIKTKQDLINCENALAHYKQSDRVSRGYVQNGSTWFNNWEDWITDPDPGEDLEFKKMKESLK